MTVVNLSKIGLKPIEVIGSGSDGIVVKAINQTTNRNFAVKLVNIGGNFEKRFDKEARNVLRLNGHKNIVQTKSYHKLSNYGVIVMEYLENDLMRYFLSKGKLKEKKVKKIFYEMCKSVQFCHSKQIAHLDLKPDNFLYDHITKSVKLCDFHRSIHWKNLDLNNFNYNINDLTSMKYRAPELQYPNFPSIDFSLDKIDVWSLGVCLFGFLYSVFPFQAIDDHSLDYNFNYLAKFLNNNLDFEVSIDAKDLILKMLTFDPLLRPSLDSLLSSHPFFDSFR